MVAKLAAIDFNKYLLPSSVQNSQLSNSKEQNSSQESNGMPALLFRDYICSGMSKKDDDHLARTNPVYLRLELTEAFCIDNEEDIGKNAPTRQ